MKRVKSKAKMRSDSILFYVPSAYVPEFSSCDLVKIQVNDKVIVGKLIRHAGKFYVRVPKTFASLIKEGEEYEIKKI